MATEARVTLISAGCSSFCFGSKAGFAGPITDTTAVKGVRAALHAETVGGLLGAFGNGKPLVISGESLEDFADTRRLEFERAAHLGNTVWGGTIAVRLSDRSNKLLIDETTRAMLTAFYGVGFFSMLCMFGANREAFLRSYPVLPTPAIPSSQVRFAVRWIARESVFIAVAPFVMVLVMFSWLFYGSWQYRRQLLAFFWSFMVRPLDAFLILVVGLGAAILTLAAYVLVALALISFGVDVVNKYAIGVYDWPHPMAILLWGLCLAYWVAACVLSHKLHRKLSGYTRRIGHDEQI